MLKITIIVLMLALWAIQAKAGPVSALIPAQSPYQEARGLYPDCSIAGILATELKNGIIIWNKAGPLEIPRLGGKSGRVTFPRFSPSGKKIVYLDWGAKLTAPEKIGPALIVADTETGQPLVTYLLKPSQYQKGIIPSNFCWQDEDSILISKSSKYAGQSLAWLWDLRNNSFKVLPSFWINGAGRELEGNAQKPTKCLNVGSVTTLDEFHQEVINYTGIWEGKSLLQKLGKEEDFLFMSRRNPAFPQYVLYTVQGDDEKNYGSIVVYNTVKKTRLVLPGYYTACWAPDGQSIYAAWMGDVSKKDEKRGDIKHISFKP